MGQVIEFFMHRPHILSNQIKLGIDVFQNDSGSPPSDHFFCF